LNKKKRKKKKEKFPNLSDERKTKHACEIICLPAVSSSKTNRERTREREKERELS